MARDDAARGTSRPADRRHRSALALGALLALPVLLMLPSCASNEMEAAESSNDPMAISRPSSDLSDLVTDVAGLTIKHAEWSKLGYRWDWTSAPSLNARAAVVHLEPMDDAVAVMDSTTRMTIFDAASGHLRWTANTTSATTKFVGLKRAGRAILAFGRSELFAVDINNGGLLARQPMAISVASEPEIIDRDLAIFGTPTGRLLAHAFGTTEGDLLPPPRQMGLTRWQYQLTGAINTKPARVGSTVGVVTQAGDIFFADARTGSGVGRTSIARGTEANPVADDRTMYVASVDQSVYAFEPKDAELRWRYRTAAPLTDPIALHNGVLYVQVPGQGLTALDADSGSELWINPDTSGYVAAVRRGKLVVFENESASLVDTNRGDTLATASLPGIVRFVPTSFVDGTIYALGENGAVARFDPR